MNCAGKHNYENLTQHIHSYLYMHSPDINECEGSSDLCHSNATCSNTPGSYVCSCKDGYSGNGPFCAGICENNKLLKAYVV